MYVARRAHSQARMRSDIRRAHEKHTREKPPHTLLMMYLTRGAAVRVFRTSCARACVGDGETFGDGDGERFVDHVLGAMLYSMLQLNTLKLAEDWRAVMVCVVCATNGWLVLVSSNNVMCNV